LLPGDPSRMIGYSLLSPFPLSTEKTDKQTNKQTKAEPGS